MILFFSSVNKIKNRNIDDYMNLRFLQNQIKYIFNL